MSGEFPQPKSKPHPEVVDPAMPAVDVLHGSPVVPHVPMKNKILQILKENGALTATDVSRLVNYPTHAVWKYLQNLEKEAKIIRYDEMEIFSGHIEVFYELNDPHSSESNFHKVFIEKAIKELIKVGGVKTPHRWNNPDLIFNDRIAIEVETGSKEKLGGFVSQVEKRFAQGYGAVIVVVLNKRQKKRYEEALKEVKNTVVVTLKNLSKTASKAKI
jgi:DNA-binding Lrp family transcriptional regulator